MKVIVLLGILFVFLTAQQNSVNFDCATTNPTTNACLTCPPQLSLDSAGICGIYSPVDGCAIYKSFSPYNCAQCNITSRFYEGSCVSLPSNCAEGWGQSECIRCNSNHLLLDYVYCASLNVNACGLASFPRLQLGQPYCQTYDNVFCSNTNQSQLCTQCLVGYELVNGLCLQVIAKAPCANNNCSCTKYFYQDVCYQFGLEGCLISQDNIDCDVCQDKHQSGGFYCYKPLKADDMHCNNVNADGDCTGCNNDYFLTANLYCVKDFKQCGEKGNCTACINSRFTLSNGLCYYDDGHCLVYDFTKTGACLTCDLLYSLNANNVCVKTEPCQTYDQTGLICTKCFSTFQLNTGGGCDPLPLNCLSMNSTGCSSCTPNTDLWLNSNNNYQCVYSTTYCLVYNVYGRCNQCDSSKSVVLLNSYCVATATNCLTPFPRDLTRCQVCSQNYHIDRQSNTCFLNMAGCYSYLSGSNCSICSSGYYLIGTQCLAATSDCMGLTSDGACVSCGNGYVSVNNYCLIYDPYCDAYDLNTRVCKSSQFDSFSVGSMSQGQINDYRTFINNSINGVVGASSGSGNFDSKNLQIISLPYAGVTSTMVLSYDFNGVITACKTPYTLFNTQCVSLTPNCLQYNIIGACQICQSGYDMGPAGACVLSTTASCTLRNNNVCLNAAQGYTLYNGNAYSTSRYGISAGGTVPSGYFLLNGLAWKLNVGCLSQNPTGKCDTCKPGFGFYSGKCVVLRYGCTVYNAYGICSGCTTSTMLWAGQCRQKQCNNLNTINLSTGYCLSCEPGYNYFLGICIPPSLPNCLAYYQLGCLSCTAGYYLSSALTCQLLPINCVQASTRDICTSCVANYIVSNSNCVRIIPFCDKYSVTGACVAASFGYSIINGGTLAVQNINHCVTMKSATECSICDPSYQPISQGNLFLCVLPIARCAMYDVNSGCTQCITGYVLQNNMCRSIRCAVFTNVCTSCIPPFLINSANYCTDPNCMTYVNQTCQSCSPAWSLINGDCVIPVPNCVQYERGICSLCVKQYAPVANRCVNVLTTISNCNIYDQNHQYCVTCLANYNIPSDPDAKTCCVASVPHCATYSCNGCKSCYIEYTLPTDQFTFSCCVLKVAYCSTYNCTGCTSCLNGLQLSANFTCSIPNCLQQIIVNGINICKQCKVGYNYPSVNIQTCCVQPIIGCLNQGCNGCIKCQGSQQLINGNCGCLTYVAPKCTQCLTGLISSADGQCCLTSVPNCQAYSCSGCSSCSTGFIGVGSPFSCCVASVTQCSSYNCGGGCIACTGSLILQNGQCSNFIVNCANQTGSICIQCSNGYQTPSLTQNSCCVQVKPLCTTYNCAGCASCQSPFTLNNLTCGIANCQTFTNNLCSVCTPPYALSVDLKCCLTAVANCANYSCSGCQACFVGYNLQPGICISSVPNCVSFSNTGQCVSCASPFTPVSTGNCCVSPISNCLIISCNGCSQCGPGFTVSSGICSSGAISDCSSYSTNSQNQTICVSCNPMFNLPSDQSGSCCIASVNNCQTYTCPGGCTQCNPSNFLNGQRCYPASINNCLTYGLINGSPVCTSCAINYQSDPSQACCIGVINNCRIYSCSQGCTACASGYTIQPGDPSQCVSVGQIPNCQILKQDPRGLQCSLCNPGFNTSTNSNCCTATQLNCIQYSCSGCSSCAIGYSIYQNSQCALQNCLTFGATLNICMACITNYILINTQGNNCCVPTVPLCRSYSCLGCQSCQSGFTLKANGLCEQPIPNCESFITNSTSMCLKCVAGYTRSKDATCCVKQVANCMQFDCFGCTACQFGTTMLSNGNCGIANCAQISFNGLNSTCLRCIANFMMPNPRLQSCCVPITVNCLAYQCLGCIQCAPGLNLLPDRTCGLHFCLSFGQSATGAYYCSVCVNSYIPPNDGSRSCCIFAYANCLTYNCSGCTKCSPGFYINNGSCSIMNCLQVVSSICTTCNQGYTQDTTNTCCVLQLTNCILYSCTQGCIRCASGSTLVNRGLSSTLMSGVCSSTSISNCQAGSSVMSGINLICLSCIYPYALPTDNSKMCCVVPPSNCNAYTCNGCTQCALGYSPQADRTCGILNCLSTGLSNGNYFCQTCAAGYTGNNGLNSQCCLRTVIACVAYDCGGCTQCSNGYPPVNAQCQVLNCLTSSVNLQNVPICLQCANGYSPPSDRSQLCCLLSVNNCINYSCGSGCTICLPPNTLSSFGQCMSPCQNGYYYSNNANGCVNLPLNCLAASTSGYCLSCAPGYTPSKSLVNPCVSSGLPQFCVSSVGGVCTQCSSGYSLSTDQVTGAVTCVMQVSFCQRFVNGVCYSCIAGYTLDTLSGICVVSSTICTNWDSSKRCIGCPNRYYILNYACYQYPLYCAAVDLLGNCLSCAFGSSLSNGFCAMTSVDARSTNCQYFNSTNNLCQTCLPGYYFCSGAGVCLMLDPTCSTYSADQQSCISCKTGYQSYNGRCLMYPPGVLSTIGGVSCAVNYVNVGTTCVRSVNSLLTVSSMGNSMFTYSSGAPLGNPFINSAYYWRPATDKMNEYFGISTLNGFSMIIFQIGIMGSQSGWITNYIIQYRNKPNSPFICYRNCMGITGAVSPSVVATLRLDQPIVASDIRIYPVAWFNGITSQIELWVLQTS